MQNKKPDGKLPEVYYDLKKSSYWMRSGSIYMELSSADFKRHALLNGFPVQREADGISDWDRALAKTQIHRHINWAGPLAGHKAGALTLPDGSRILVTREINPVTPADVPFPFLEKYLDELFGEKQLPYVLAWLKIAHASLTARKYQPGQLLAMGGPANCGKSLFHYVVTKFLGGRCGKPYRYMSGQTTFNGDLACAEHLFIEDEDSSYDLRSRRRFGNAIKDFCVNEFLSVHDKGYQAVTLPFWRRMTCSFNDEAENVMIMPPMDESIADKVMLMKCGRATLPLDRAKIQAKIEKELPGLAFACQNYVIPKALLETNGNRFGVRAYHHPDLMQALSDMSQEIQLLSIIDETLFDKPAEDELLWRGSAEKLMQTLLNSKAAWTAQRIFSFPSACGTYLARLKTKFPDRISSVFNEGRKVWTIKPTTKGE